MIFFLICADEEVGWRVCRERGWTMAGINRFWTPERNDVRVVRRFTDIALLPGGTWFMAGADFHLNPNADEFLQLVTGGQAKWIPEEEPTEDQMKWIARKKDKEPPEPKEPEPKEPAPRNSHRGSPPASTATPTPTPPSQEEQTAAPMPDREPFRERYRAELLRRGSSGARPGRAPSPQ